MLCAPNAFKGTLTAQAAAAAMAAGVRAAGAEAVEVPVADGGDGTLDVLLAAAGPSGRLTEHEVTGPLGASVRARLGWLDDTTAVVEMAEAAGLRLLGDGRPDALAATSRGAGELITAALEGGARRVVVGVGGSATTDGGMGMLEALGARFLDASGAELLPGGGALTRLERVDLGGLEPRLRGATLSVAADVRNPLSGPDGAAYVFAPQKGATESEVAVLDAGLTRLAAVAERDLGAAGLADRPGTGAAGGAAFALALLGAELVAGAALVCDLVGLDAALPGCALVLTGEGRLDAQTSFGKAPAEVAERARRAGVPCAVIAGSVLDPLGGLFQRAVSLHDVAPNADPRAHALELVRRASAQLAAALLPAQ